MIIRADALDPSQDAALARVQAWLDKRLVDPKYPQVFRLGGPAGSGKTTLIREVVAYCDDRGVGYALAAIAGKAADVLRRKGLDKAQTIHSLIYTPNAEAISEVQRLTELLSTAHVADLAGIREDLKRQRDLSWQLRTTIDADLIIVDEASMVSSRMANQLRSFGRPILAVGDPAQLPPVDNARSGDPLFYAQTPYAELTGAHRFGDTAILGEAARAARANEPLPAELIVPIGEVDLLDFDVVLTNTKADRWKYVAAVRSLRGLPLDRPVVGDRITFWGNKREENVFNGGSVLVESITENTAQSWSIRGTTETGEMMRLLVDKRGFHDETSLTAAVGRSDFVVASFSEALHVHKAQGSEWDNVLVAGHPYIGHGADNAIRWRYTAITRAAKRLVLAHRDFATPVPLPKGGRIMAA